MKKLLLIFAIATYLLAPPLMYLGYSVLLAYNTYTGICPGLMDIDPYPCTLGEYIERHTISPFAAMAHLLVWGGWLTFALFTLALGAAGYYFFSKKQA